MQSPFSYAEKEQSVGVKGADEFIDSLSSRDAEKKWVVVAQANPLRENTHFVGGSMKLIADCQFPGDDAAWLAMKIALGFKEVVVDLKVHGAGEALTVPVVGPTLDRAINLAGDVDGNPGGRIACRDGQARNGGLCQVGQLNGSPPTFKMKKCGDQDEQKTQGERKYSRQRKHAGAGLVCPDVRRVIVVDRH